MLSFSRMPSTTARRTGLAAGLAVGLTVTSLAVLAPTVAAAAGPTGQPTPAGTPSSVRTIALADATTRLTTRAAATPSVTDSGEQQTKPFSLVGVSWDRSSANAASFSVRTRTGGRWTGWSALTTSDVAPDAGGRDDRATDRRTTEPLWVGASDGVQIKLVSAPRTIRDVRIELVDPGTNPADAALATPPAAAPQARPGTANAVAARAPGIAPPIISRQGWGADERLRSYNPNCTVDYGTTVKMGFVHHTDNANNYSAADVPGIVRSIYAYHVQSNHWCDVGYNFLVDRFGRIFEGRYGGTFRAVVGAHTGGYNVDSFAASMIGDFSATTPPAAMMNAMADLYAWKLGSYYRNPTGRTVMVAGAFDGNRYPTGSRVTFNTISGHRDADFTDCPGNAAYAMLPTLRSMVAARLPHSAIASRYASLGGPGGVLGEPTMTGELAVPYGLMTQFQHGSITWAAPTGARMLDSAFTAAYLRVGGPSGVLGFPTNRDQASANGGSSASFQRGYMHSSPATGPHETHGSIAGRFQQIGYERGPLGWPTTDELVAPDGVGRYNRFQSGNIYWTRALGAHEVYGAVFARWGALRYEKGVLGYPATNPVVTPDGTGVSQRFERGVIFWTPGTGSHEVRGSIRDAYAAQGWERGTLGYPTTDERTVSPGVVATDFQHGSISWETATGRTTVTTAP